MKGFSYDSTATNFAHGIAPDYTRALAEIMAPQCVQPAAAGQFIKFDDDAAFRYLDTRRALGGDMTMIDFPAGAPKFNCDPHAIGIATDAFEKQRVGDAGLPMLREAKIRTLVSRNALSREQRVYQAYADGVAAEDGLGVWASAAVDPIDELNQIVCGVATETGNPAIHLVIALNVLQQLGKHPKVLARMPGAALITVTAEVIGKMLQVPCTVHVGMMPIVLQKEGKAGTKGVIGAGKVYALLSQSNPSPFDPSAAKTFTTKLGQVDGVGFVDRPPFSEINFMSWSEEIQITGAKCVKRIDATLGAIA